LDWSVTIPTHLICWKTLAKPSAQLGICQTTVYACVHVDLENRSEEFGVGVAQFFSFSSVFPLPLQCCQSPWGWISAAAIGRLRLSKYMF